MLKRIAVGMQISGMAVGLFAPDDTLQYASQTYIKLYDIQPGPQTFNSLMRHCWQRETGPQIRTGDIDGWLAMANLKRRSQEVRQFEVDMVDGRWMWACETTFSDGWVLLTVTDFTEVKLKEFLLKNDRDAAIQASETDHLTRLYNRGAVMSRLETLIEKTKAFGGTFSIVLADLDLFKQINDRFGHDSGDQVLTHFSACASSIMRERDILGRVGGEEFMFVMPDASSIKACAVVERLQAHIRDQRLKLGTVTLRYTFSAGVAEWVPGKTIETLYREADQALYAAKAAGRNLVRLAS